MVGESCLPSYAYFPWMPDYTLLFWSMSVCLNIPNLVFVYIDFYHFPKNEFGKVNT